MLTLKNRQPATAKELAKIISGLEKRPFIQSVTLSTADGLAIVQTGDKAKRTAATASLMASAAQQAQLMLNLDDYNEIMLSLQNNTFLLYRPFTANKTRLMLTVLFNQQTTHKRLLTQTCNDIIQLIENYSWE